MSKARVLKVYLGPQHPGAPGNVAFKLLIDGERVLDIDLIPGFLHRGFEKMMEYRRWDMDLVMSARICVEDPDHVELSYTHAIEQVFGIEPPEKAKYIRVIVAEFSRLASHLLWMMHFAGPIAARYATSWAIAAREEILKWFDYVAGHRVYHHYIFPGGVRWNIPSDFKEKTLKVLKIIKPLIKDLEEGFFKHPVFIRRARDMGRLKASDAIRLGATGPVLRGSGVAHDMRKVLKYDAYGEIDFEIPRGDYGDSYDRALVRLREMYISMDIIRQAVEKMPMDGPYRWKLPLAIPVGEGIGRVESARGEFITHIINVRHGRYSNPLQPYRIKFRGPTMAHLTTVLKHIIHNEEITVADLPVLIGSFDPCPPDIDR
jgi:NADH-quinone oxidoreductase subunit D